MVGYKLSKNDWVTPFFVIFRSVREILLVTVFCKHPVVDTSPWPTSSFPSSPSPPFLGPRGSHGIPLSISPSVRKKNLDHIFTGIYASWIGWRLIKPTPPQPSTTQYHPVPPCTAKYSPLKPSTVQYSPVPPSTAHHSTVLPSIAQYRQVQPINA